MSDETEAITAAAEGMVSGAMKPIGDLVQALLGPAANEVGLMVNDSVRFYRWKRRLRLLKRTKKVLSAAGIEPTHVPLKMLMPIIENGTNEEEDSLQDIWANLLANAAAPDPKNRVFPSFPEILKELTARDVKFLNALFEVALQLSKAGHENMRIEEVIFVPKQLDAIFLKMGLARQRTNRKSRPRVEDIHADVRDRRLSMDTFERQGVLEKVYKAIERDRGDGIDIGIARSFTSLGACFVAACREPKAAE